MFSLDPNRYNRTGEAIPGSRLLPLALIRFRFHAAATARMNELAEKNRKGTNEPSDRALLERYQRVGNFLKLIHARARGALA